jgi:glycosyltransferase involved in cell wall biosynthesis
MISAIIPTYNEADNIAKLINFLLTNGKNDLLEIIISDGGSVDNTLQQAKNLRVTALVSPKKGRAAQMNYAASIAKGDILYFIHADTIPPVSFVDDIYTAIAEGYSLGRYRTIFDSKKRY